MCCTIPKNGNFAFLHSDLVLYKFVYYSFNIIAHFLFFNELAIVEIRIIFTSKKT